jgi:hypothetical protein
MANSNVPPPSNQEDFENPLEELPFVKKVKDIRPFLNTREAILEGEKLYNLSQGQIKERGLLGPWAFNAVQSTIDSLPGIVVGACITLLWPFAKETPALDPLAAKILSSLSPLLGPFTLLLVVYVIAYTCLPPGFETKPNWKAAQRKYLYLDAAHGFWCQFFLALAIALAGVPQAAAAKSDLAFLMKGIGGLALLACFVWATLIGWRIKTKLFDIDYLTDRPAMFVPVIYPSEYKYWTFAGLGVVAVVYGLQFAVRIISIGLANLIHQLQHS